MTLALQTKNLELVAVDAALGRALITGPQALGRILDARVPPDWPPELGRIISAPVPPEWPPEHLVDAVELLARS